MQFVMGVVWLVLWPLPLPPPEDEPDERTGKGQTCHAAHDAACDGASV